MEELCTQRLRIVPLSPEELQGLVDQYRDCVPELSQAYGEMLENCRQHPRQRLWYTSWKFCREEGDAVGYAGFKGLQADGSAEIGYGVDEAFEGQGYATEGVTALCRWAFSTGLVSRIEAETAPDNRASQRVLEKCGFTPTGQVGEEGPRFVLLGR